MTDVKARCRPGLLVAAIVAATTLVRGTTACSGELDYLPPDGSLPPDKLVDASVGQEPTEPQAVASNPAPDDHPSLIRAKDGTYYLAFDSLRDGLERIWLSTSADGLAWSDPRAITPPVERASQPAFIQSSDGAFHLMWARAEDADGGMTSTIMYARSADSFAWLAPIALSGSDAMALSPTITEGAPGELVAAWSSNRAGQFPDVDTDIYVRRATEYGLRWAQTEFRGDDNFNDDEPFLATGSDGSLTILWRQTKTVSAPGTAYELVFATGGAGGGSWSVKNLLAEDNRLTDFTPSLYARSDTPGWSAVWSTLSDAGVGTFRTIGLAEAPASESAIRSLDEGGQRGRSPRLVASGTPGVYLMAWVYRGDVVTRFIRP